MTNSRTVYPSRLFVSISIQCPTTRCTSLCAQKVLDAAWVLR